MATRYYLPSSGAAAVNPAFDTNWGNTTTASPDRIRAVTTKSSTALTDKSWTASNTNGPLYLMRQYVSDQIGAVDISGVTVTGVVRVLVNNVTNTTALLRLSVRLYHTDTTFTTILTLTGYDTAWGTSAATRIFNTSGPAGTSTTNGDRIVIEFGVSNGGTATGSRTYTERFGDAAASDFALTSGLTTDLNPWIEFGVTLPPATVTRRIFVTGG